MRSRRRFYWGTRGFKLEQLEHRWMLASSTTYAVESLSLDVNDAISYRFQDLDEDGWLDVAILSQTDIAWYAGSSAQGSFQHRQSFNVQASQFDLVDVDGDGLLDLLYMVDGDGVQLHLNDGFGRLDTQSREIVTVRNAEAFAVADVDDDGDQDLLIPRRHGVVLHMENDSGIFQVKEQINGVPDELAEIRMADLDGDAALDLFVASPSGAAWYKNIDGLFNHTRNEIATGAVWSPQLADVDDDGDTDAVMIRPKTDGAELVWLENNEGTFDQGQPIQTDQTPAAPSVAFVGDVDHDGDPDIVSFYPAADATSNTIVVHANLDDRSWRGYPLSGSDVKLLNLGDANDDGHLDILATRADGQLITYDFRVIGDVDGSGSFESSDLVAVLQSGQYEDDIAQNSTFREGDWDGDREFTTADLIYALQVNVYEHLTYPRLLFTRADIPSIKAKMDHPLRKSQFDRMYRTAVGNINIDYSDPTLQEHIKAQHGQRFAFLALMLEPNDPLKARFAQKAREVLANANEGVWRSFGKFPQRQGKFDFSEALHPWYTGGVLMDLSLAYDWLVGAGELSGVARQDARFRILRLAQMEHILQSTPYDEFDHAKFAIRLSNYMFRSLSGVGFAALAFPDQKGLITDPYDRLGPEHQIEFDTSETLKWVLGELFEEITTSSNFRPASGKSMVDAFITPDGVVLESFYYQLDTFSLLIPFLVTLDRQNGEDYLSSDGPADGRILEAFTTNFKTLLPDGSRPLIGDAYAGSYYLWHELVAAYTDNPGWHYSGSVTQRFGVSIVFYDDSIPKTKPDFRTEFLPDSGIAVFRDKWGSDATYLMLLAQDDAVLGHDQADQASITLYAHGTYLVNDSGYGSAYRYAPDERKGGKEDWINSALGHSTMTIDSIYTVENTPQAHLWGEEITPRVAFSYTQVPDPATIEHTLAAQHIDYAEAHVTYTEKQSKLVRAVVFPRHRYFILEDNMTSDSSHQYGWQLHLGNSGLGTLTTSDQGYVWTIPNRSNVDVSLGIYMVDDQNRNVNVYDNGPTNPTGYAYPRDVYDHTYILADKEAEDVKFVTLLDPYKDEADKLEIETLVEGRVWRVNHSATSYDLILSQTEATEIQFGEIQTDAQFLVASVDEVGGRDEVISVLARGGSEIQLGYDQQRTFQIQDDALFHFEPQ